MIRKSIALILVALAALAVAGIASAAEPRAVEEVAVAQAAEPAVYYAYLVPWQWQVTEIAEAGGEQRVVPANYWRLKYWPALGFIDMRVQSQRSCAPIFQSCFNTGRAIALYDRPLPADALDAFFISTWINGQSGLIATINNQDIGFLLFGLPDGFLANTLDGVVREIFRDYSDPAGETGPKPLSPDRQHVIKADLGPVRLFTDRVSTDSVEWFKFTQRAQLDYERILKDQGADVALKRAGYWEEKYGQDLRSPVQISRDGAPIKPATTQTDDFDCSDSDTMGCDLTWTEVLADWDIVSNTAQKTANANGTARAEASVSGDDLFGEVDCGPLVAFAWCGVAVRFDAAADTMYYFRADNDNSSYQLYSRTAGSDTLLAGPSGADYCGGTCGAAWTIKLQVNGEDLEAWRDASSKLTYTDVGGISGNDLCGLYGFHAAVAFDNFTCEDLGAAPATRRIFVMSDD